MFHVPEDGIAITESSHTMQSERVAGNVNNDCALIIMIMMMMARM